ncbi:hypothetical protein NECAME_02340 [Necator americanus]|uniref:Uncharacterized protein n=1 Tax=Necator americanus TaxID=51031 RepID=W2TFG6_NECAM|nr:hypothetical protein NECAME_02340 [Necator americanus]ETN80593.1 hypothetical protein NECAME_02340 [Necator americanus]
MLVPNNFEGIREDENEPDSGFHTIASKRELRDKGNNLAEAGRRFRKYRSYSLSETPSHKNSLIYGTAKNRALHSRKTSNEEQNKNRTISLPQHSAEQEKAVNNYYDRHPPSLSNRKFSTEKNYDTINGFHDYPLKRTISVVDPKDSGKSPTMPTTRRAFTLLESSIDQLTSRIQPKEEEPQETRTRTISRCSYCSHTMENPEEDKATELLNNLTIRSLATFARANADVYGGGFGRVNLRKGDLVHSKTNVDQT